MALYGGTFTGTRGTGTGWVLGGYLGGVWGPGGYWEGYTGYPAQLLEEGLRTSEAGPVGPAGAGVGGF